MAPKLHAKSTGDQIIVAAPFYFQIRGNCREGETGQDRDGVCQSYDDQSPGKTGTSNYIAQSEEKDNTKDSEDTGCEHPGKGSESTLIYNPGILLFVIAFRHYIIPVILTLQDR
jgi:hypothetical protein